MISLFVDDLAIWLFWNAFRFYNIPPLFIRDWYYFPRAFILQLIMVCLWLIEIHVVSFDYYTAYDA